MVFNAPFQQYFSYIVVVFESKKSKGYLYLSKMNPNFDNNYNIKEL